MIDKTPVDFVAQGTGVPPDQGEPEVRNDAKPTDPQLAVFYEAYALYRERNLQHQDVWKESGWMGMMVDMRKKMDRLWKQYTAYRSDEMVAQEDLDSALDLLNFTVFFIRQVRDDDRNGSWDWPG